MTGYIIKNGTVYVPGSKKFEKKNLYVKDGKLTSAFPENEHTENIRTINAEGCIVTKGLIDYHVHYYEDVTDNGVNPDAASFPNGVTTAVDGGSNGVNTFARFKKDIIDRTKVGLYAQLLVGSTGQLSQLCPEKIHASMIEEERILDLFARYPDLLVGLKSRLSSHIIDAKDAPASLEKSVNIAEKLGCNLTVHITDPAMDLEELAGILRKGDVICHVFQDKGKENILDDSGHIRKGIQKARERGVLFDASNGKNNFNIKVAKTALEQGFFPDIISSDINSNSYYEGVLHSLPKVLSKYLTFGLPLDQILDAAILKPAELIRHPELASMETGAPADLFLFRLQEHEMTYFDHTNGQNCLLGNQVIVPQMTIKNGKVVYSQVYFE